MKKVIVKFPSIEIEALEEAISVPGHVQIVNGSFIIEISLVKPG